MVQNLQSALAGFGMKIRWLCWSCWNIRYFNLYEFEQKYHALVASGGFETNTHKAKPSPGKEFSRSRCKCGCSQTFRRCALTSAPRKRKTCPSCGGYSFPSVRLLWVICELREPSCCWLANRT